jgi:hypothetical protein
MQQQDLIGAAHPPEEWLLADAEAIIDIIVTTAEALSEPQHDLACKCIFFASA